MNLQPDIVVFQECSAKDIARTNAPFKHWIGSNSSKGLAIAGFANYTYTVDRSTFRSFATSVAFKYALINPQ